MFRYGLTAFALIPCALTFVAAAHAETAPPPPPKWTVTLGGTATMMDGQNSQPAVNFSVMRAIGKGYVGLSGSVTDSHNDQAPVGLVPERIEIVTLSGGRQLGRFMLETHIVAGQGVFQQGMLPITPTQSLAVSSKADGYGLGASASINLTLAKNLMLMPRLSIDYAATKINRTPVDLSAATNQFNVKSKGVTLSGGGALQTRFGASYQHGLMVMASVMRIDNTADFIHRAGRTNVDDIQAGSTDMLVDYGAILSFGLSHQMGLDLSATRSAGANGPQSTILGAGLRVAF